MIIRLTMDPTLLRIPKVRIPKQFPFILDNMAKNITCPLMGSTLFKVECTKVFLRSIQLKLLRTL